MGKKCNTQAIKVDSDAAKRAVLLLDTISIIKEAARALGDFKSMYLDNDEYTGKHMPKKATNDINTIIDELKRDKYGLGEETSELTSDEETSNGEMSKEERTSNESHAARQLEEFKSKYLENIIKPIPKKATSGVDTRSSMH